MDNTLENAVLKLYPEFVKILGPYIRRKDKRKYIMLYNGKVKTTRMLAKVKLEVKIGRRLVNDETADHIDEDPINDAYENLQILTKSENARKSCYLKPHTLEMTDGLRRKRSENAIGAKNGNAIFTTKQVKRLRKEYADKKISIVDISKEYKISRRSVKDMLRGNTYSNIGGATTKFKSRAGAPKKFTERDIKKMVYMRKQGYSNIKIAEIFNTHVSTISKKIACYF